MLDLLLKGVSGISNNSSIVIDELRQQNRESHIMNEKGFEPNTSFQVLRGAALVKIILSSDFCKSEMRISIPLRPLKHYQDNTGGDFSKSEMRNQVPFAFALLYQQVEI